jgi:FecR-like protein
MDRFMTFRAIILTGVISVALPVSGQVTPLASVQNTVGIVVIVRSGGIQERLHGKGNVLLYEGDTVKTESASQGMIAFKDGVQVAVNEHTSFKVLTRWMRGRSPIYILRMKEGEVWVRTGEGRKLLEVETPVATAAAQDAVQDAEFDVRLRPDGTAVLTVISGVADFATSFGTCSVTASTVSSSSRGKPCTSPVRMEVMPSIAWINGIRNPAEPQS